MPRLVHGDPGTERGDGTVPAPGAAQPGEQHASTVFVRSRQHERELLAAVARERVALAGHVTQARGEHAQCLVARGVAQCVVHLLEVVEVDHDHCVAGHDPREPG